MGFDATDDCCYRPCFGGDSCCGSNGYQCGEGEGDCDYDSDCKPGLVCGKDNCKNPDIHPGVITILKVFFQDLLYTTPIFNVKKCFYKCLFLSHPQHKELSRK